MTEKNRTPPEPFAKKPAALEVDTPWVGILPSEVSAHRGPMVKESTARSWALVLEARGIPNQLKTTGWGWQVHVPQLLRERALREIRLFERENRNWPPRLPPAPALLENSLATFSVLLTVGTFHNLTLLGPRITGLFRADWIAQGNAHAGKILSGQWWRLVTSLTLHADGLHLMSNLLLGGVFILLLCRQTGSGLGWSLVLLSGSLGNLLNALVQIPSHRAVGASTAVFGAVAILAGINLVQNRSRLLKRWPLPLAAAMALLALLGAGGERTDLGSHLFGFATGLLLGLAGGAFLKNRGRPGPLVNALLATGAASAVILAWLAVLEGAH